MKKWLIGSGILIIALAAAAAFLVSRLDGMITNAVNTYGPELTGTGVRVEDVSVSFSGRVVIQKLLLVNPRGYRAQSAIVAEAIDVRLEPLSLLTDTVRIRKIEITRPDVIYEKRGGTDNFKTIAHHAEQKARETGLAGSPGAAAAPGKKIAIGELIITNGRVTLYTPDLPSSKASAVIPDIRLYNLGKDGAPPSEVLSTVLAVLYDRLTMPIVVDSLNRSLTETGRGARRGTDSVVDKIKGFFK